MFGSNIFPEFPADNFDSITTGVVVTETTLCPVTETKTVGGSTITVVYTTTSEITKVIPTTIVQYTTLAPVVTSIETFVYETSTSLCPVTETKTVSGKPVEVIYTSTSVVVVKVPTTIIDYTTALTTCYETTEVYVTESEYETKYTTVSAGSTIVLTDTLTSTIDVTAT